MALLAVKTERENPLPLFKMEDAIENFQNAKEALIHLDGDDGSGRSDIGGSSKL